MKHHLFNPKNANISDEKALTHARYELWRTCIEFFAALTFIIGSFMFLSEDWEHIGTWFFIVGSFCFALSPMIKLAREYQMAKDGQVKELAQDFES